jgi:TPR repeat protein
LRPAIAAEDPDAMVMMADCLATGIGVRKDPSRALELLKLAQVQGRDTRVERGQLRRRMRGMD